MNLTSGLTTNPFVIMNDWFDERHSAKHKFKTRTLLHYIKGTHVLILTYDDILLTMRALAFRVTVYKKRCITNYKPL